jgi:hypothetical protein
VVIDERELRVKISVGINRRRRVGRFLAIATVALGMIGATAAGAAGAVGSAPGATSGPAGSAGTAKPQTLYFQIRARHSNKCLDLDTGSPSPSGDGARVQQWTCLGPDQRNQVWRVVENSDGTYTIKSLFSGTCLDAAGAGTANGTHVQMWTCNGNVNQRWYIDFVSNDFYYWIRPAYDTSNCLDVDTAFPDPVGDGAPVQLWDCLPNEPGNQLWRLLSS